MTDDKNIDDALDNIFKQLENLNKRLSTIEAELGTYYKLSEDEQDPLYEKAVKIVREYDRASASLLQRRLGTGYARAAWLLDQLEESGVVGPGEGSSPRIVLKEK